MVCSVITPCVSAGMADGIQLEMICFPVARAVSLIWLMADTMEPLSSCCVGKLLVSGCTVSPVTDEIASGDPASIA